MRILSIYKLEKDFLIAYCYLRDDKRTFIKDRIKSANIQEDEYKIPNGWVHFFC